jgi:hypothetical protein
MTGVALGRLAAKAPPSSDLLGSRFAGSGIDYQSLSGWSPSPSPQDNTASWRALEKARRRRWAVELASDDPSDEGPMYLYHRERPAL